MDYSYSYSFDSSTLSPGAMMAIYIPTLILCAFLIVCMWKLFTKCGEAGWKSLIPFYNIWIQIKLFWDGNPVVPFILMFVPFANFVILIMLYVKMARSFGKGGGFAVGLIFLSIIFIPILAFGSDEYIGPNGDFYARSFTSGE